MDLKQKLSLMKQILLDQGDCSKILEKNNELDNKIQELILECDRLKENNDTLFLENEKLKSINENLQIVTSEEKGKIKLIKPDKLVIAKYSLYINKSRTHIGAFTKKDIVYGSKKTYSPFTYEKGYVLQGLLDKNLCGLLDEYGEQFKMFIDSRNVQYNSNILVYDYITLPQLLSIINEPVILKEKGVTLENIDFAVNFAESHKDDLFNKNLPKRKILNNRTI